jgi:tellurium resistance protein TerD
MIEISMNAKPAVNRETLLSLNSVSVRGALQRDSLSSVMFKKEQDVATRPVAARPVAARPDVQLVNKVQKGQKVQLSGTAPDYVEVRLGWKTLDSRCDVDVSAFMLGADGKVIGDDWFVFYGQTLSPDSALTFSDNDSTDIEKIAIDFTRLNSTVKKIVFVLTINDAFTNRLNFSMLKDAYIRITDKSGGELVSFMMDEYYPNVISMMIGELYIHNGIWKFNAVGNGVAKDLAGLCELYGVQVKD